MFTPGLQQVLKLVKDYLITAFKISTGLLDIDPKLFFLPPNRCGLRGHPYKVLQGASHRRRKGKTVLVRAVKCCYYL